MSDVDMPHTNALPHMKNYIMECETSAYTSAQYRLMRIFLLLQNNLWTLRYLKIEMWRLISKTKPKLILLFAALLLFIVA